MYSLFGKEVYGEFLSFIVYALDISAINCACVTDFVVSAINCACVTDFVVCVVSYVFE